MDSFFIFEFSCFFVKDSNTVETNEKCYYEKNISNFFFCLISQFLDKYFSWSRIAHYESYLVFQEEAFTILQFSMRLIKLTAESALITNVTCLSSTS